MSSTANNVDSDMDSYVTRCLTLGMPSVGFAQKLECGECKAKQGKVWACEIV